MPCLSCDREKFGFKTKGSSRVLVGLETWRTEGLIRLGCFVFDDCVMRSFLDRVVVNSIGGTALTCFLGGLVAAETVLSSCSILCFSDSSGFRVFFMSCLCIFLNLAIRCSCVSVICSKSWSCAPYKYATGFDPFSPYLLKTEIIMNLPKSNCSSMISN